MAFGSDLGPYMAGEIRILPIPFAPSAGETLVAAQAGVQMWQFSPIADAHAAALLIGSPFVSGATVNAVVGGAWVAGVSGFQLGAVYSLWVNVTTSFGQTLEGARNFAISPSAPPAFSAGGEIPNNEFDVTTNFTPSAPGTYFLMAANLTFTVPSASVGGDFSIVDLTGAPNLTISGTILNNPGLTSITGANFALPLRGSALHNGYIEIS